MRKNLSHLEKRLLETQDVMEVRGKLGRPVPVVIPEDTREVLGYLASANVRKDAGVLSTNKYLFPNKSVGVIRSYESMKKLCEEINLKKPEKITSVNLRKYTAIISQIFDLSTMEQQWLTNHLGHTMDIHKIHYRQTAGVTERVDLAKLMLMQELNITGKYAGKKLSDIQLPEMLFDSACQTVTGSDNDEPERCEPEPESCVGEGDDYQPIFLKEDNYDEYNFPDDDDGGDDSDGDDQSMKERRKSKKGTSRVKWTVPEVEEIKKYFKDQLRSKVTPGRKEVERGMQRSKENKGLIHMRQWETIKKENMEHESEIRRIIAGKQL